jgi:hypothetical protein
VRGDRIGLARHVSFVSYGPTVVPQGIHASPLLGSVQQPVVYRFGDPRNLEGTWRGQADFSGASLYLGAPACVAEYFNSRRGEWSGPFRIVMEENGAIVEIKTFGPPELTCAGTVNIGRGDELPSESLYCPRLEAPLQVCSDGTAIQEPLADEYWPYDDNASIFEARISGRRYSGRLLREFEVGKVSGSDFVRGFGLVEVVVDFDVSR